MPETHLKKSFAPVVDNHSQILILGSMPGDRSLQLAEYYAHPQNRFWSLIAHLTRSDKPDSYQTKLNMLKDTGIALWDVAQQAYRPGSMDSNMKGEKPNDIEALLRSYPAIRAIAFNGRKAEHLYKKHFQLMPNINYYSLPSTSPANAGYGFEMLYNEWSAIAPYVKRKSL